MNYLVFNINYTQIVGLLILCIISFLLIIEISLFLSYIIATFLNYIINLMRKIKKTHLKLFLFKKEYEKLIEMIRGTY